MNHFPHIMAFVTSNSKGNKMFNHDDINKILNELADAGMVEPIDDPSIQTDFYDWADVVGITDEIEPETEWA